MYTERGQLIWGSGSSGRRENCNRVTRSFTEHPRAARLLGILLVSGVKKHQGCVLLRVLGVLGVLRVLVRMRSWVWRARADYSLTHRLHAHAESEQSRPRPCRLPLTHIGCARTRRANSRIRVRAGSSLSLSHTPGGSSFPRTLS